MTSGYRDATNTGAKHAISNIICNYAIIQYNRDVPACVKLAVDFAKEFPKSTDEQ